MKRSREPEDHSPSRNSPSSPSPSVAPKSGSTSPYEDSDAAALPRAKFIDLDPDQADADGAGKPAMICLLHREKMDFPSYDAYEAHYHKEHVNRCIECHRNFPSAHYLGLHTDECHDPFVAVKRDKGEHTYACFVEDCDRKCGSADKRRRHLIDKHYFPKNFFFGIPQYGIDGRHSLLGDGNRYQHRRNLSAADAKMEARQRTGSIIKSGDSASAPSSPSKTRNNALEKDQRQRSGRDVDVMEEDGSDKTSNADPQEGPDVDMDDLAGAMSAMTFVPRSVKFGRGGRVGFSRR